MKKIIKLSENDLHNIITESVKRVLNEMNPQTYYNASDKAYNLGQYDRSIKLKNHGENIANNELETDDERYYFQILKKGFNTIIEEDGEEYDLSYILDSDNLYVRLDGYDDKLIEPGNEYMRTHNRALIRKILQYFAKYKPDSKYNNKNYWIA